LLRYEVTMCVLLETLKVWKYRCKRWLCTCIYEHDALKIVEDKVNN